MALSLDQLAKARDDLIAARAQCVRVFVDQNGERVEYKSDAEMASALAALDRQIAELGGRAAPRTVRFKTTKGL